MKKLFNLFTDKLVTPILVVLLVAALFFGLRPFSFVTENNVQWLEEGDGLFISPPQKEWRSYYAGQIFTKDKFALANYPNLTIELWLSAKGYDTSGISTILHMDDGSDPPALIFGQWHSSLSIRARASDAEYGYKEVGLGEALIRHQKSFVTVTTSPEGTKLYLNGELKNDYPGKRLIDPKINDVQLIAGVRASGSSRWRGEIYGLAVYGDTLSAAQVNQHYRYWHTGNFNQLDSVSTALLFYPFDEKRGTLIHNKLFDQHHWHIPERFEIRRKPFLGVAHRDKHFRIENMFKDIAINLVGFILLGFFLALWLNRRISSKPSVVILVIFICSLLSLGIEYAQVWLPQRDSALLDFAINSLGGFIGAWGIVVLGRIQVQGKKEKRIKGEREKGKGKREKEGKRPRAKGRRA